MTEATVTTTMVMATAEVKAAEDGIKFFSI